MGIRKRKPQPYPEQALHGPNYLFDIVENTKELSLNHNQAYLFLIWSMCHSQAESM